MEEFHNIYRFLSEIIVGVHSWSDKETLKTLKSMIQDIEPLINEKCAHILIKTWINALDDDPTANPSFKPSLKNVMMGIFEVEKVLTRDIITEMEMGTDTDTEKEKDVNTDVARTDAITRTNALKRLGEVLAHEGPVYIREKIFEKIEQLPKPPLVRDVTDMIQNMHKEIGVKLKGSTSDVYARGYIHYLAKKEKEIKTPLSDVIRCPECNEPMVKSGWDDGKQRYQCTSCKKKILDSYTKKEEKKETEQEEKREEKTHEEKNPFEQFQAAILAKAKTLNWDKVRIEKIEREFPNKTVNQVQSALSVLISDGMIKRQDPPGFAEVQKAKEQQKSKPKGYILF